MVTEEQVDRLAKSKKDLDEARWSLANAKAEHERASNALVKATNRFELHQAEFESLLKNFGV